MRDYLLAAFLFPALFGVWLVTDHLYRRFHRRHPELQPPPRAGGCGGACGCGGGACGRPTDSPGNPHQTVDEE